MRWTDDTTAEGWEKAGFPISEVKECVFELRRGKSKEKVGEMLPTTGEMGRPFGSFGRMGGGYTHLVLWDYA